MAIDYLDVMKTKVQQALYSDEQMDFTRFYDNMVHLPLSYYIPWNVICQINKLVTSLKYADKLSYKKKEIVKLLSPYGFRKFASGTNRLTLNHIEDHSFLIKVALDNVGMRNNPDEYVNSILLKPFMPKVFDVSPCGTIALVERVMPITCWQEAKSIAPDVFNLIIYHIIGKFVAADIGTKYYMNWGVRYGFGPVILDLTDLYELDGKKLYCNWLLPNGCKCNGEIDYDDGFNNLVCNKCGHVYEARQLAKQIDDEHGFITTTKGGINMAISLIENGKVIARSDNVSETILTRASRRRRPNITTDSGKKSFSGIRLVFGDDNKPDNTPVVKEENTMSVKLVYGNEENKQVESSPETPVDSNESVNEVTNSEEETSVDVNETNDTPEENNEENAESDDHAETNAKILAAGNGTNMMDYLKEMSAASLTGAETVDGGKV